MAEQDTTEQPTDSEKPRMTAMQFPDIPGFEFHAPEGTPLQQACDVLLKMASIVAWRGWNEAEGYRKMSEDLKSMLPKVEESNGTDDANSGR